jgi:hypothetical protein
VSQILVQQYLNNLQDLRRVSGTTRESVVSEAFKDLLKGWGRARDLIFVPQYEIETPAKQRRIVDGALLYELRVPFGYWEAKDEEDDLDEEIERKFRRGYPQDNIVFEDSRQAVLIQNRQEVIRCGVDDPAQLQRLLELFFAHERAEVAEFRKAVAQFKTDLPTVLDALRDMIEGQLRDNAAFRTAAEEFLQHAQETINPERDRCGRAGDADSAHSDGGDLLQGFRRGRLPPTQQCGEEAVRAGGRVLHRRHQEANTEGTRTLLRSDPGGSGADLKSP